MKLLDLFAGIGGFSLAAHWMGWDTAAFVEWDAYCQKVLRKNFGSDAKIYGYIREFDGTKYRGAIDVICGGFPCQPFSSAGKRGGKSDDRYLWPEMLRVIREVGPRWVVGENVAGVLSMDGGLVFEEICASLENEGYAVQSYIIPACSKGAPHRRDRVWIVANTGRNKQGRTSNKLQGKNGQSALQQQQFLAEFSEPDKIYRSSSNSQSLGRRNGIAPDVGQAEGEKYAPGDEAGRAFANANGKGLQEQLCGELGGIHKKDGTPQGSEFSGGISAPEQWQEHWLQVATRLCRIPDGIPGGMDANRNRTARLKALGNAIVPQVAYEIFRAIQITEQSPASASVGVT